MTLDARVVVELDGFTLDVTLSVERGETVAIVGSNGAGKSTLLRALAGLCALSDGHIELDGTVLDDPGTNTYVPPERRPIGMVFQETALFPHLNARDNVAFGLRARGQARSAARTQASAWLERVGLAARGDARPRELSGGQAQRVALARALAPGPDVLLLDEPLAALDPTTRSEVRADLRRHLAGFGGIRLVVTHDPVDAAVLADRVIVLDAGRVAQTGTPAEMTARPRTPWIAEFAGTNLFAGTAAANGLVTLDGGGQLAGADELSPGPVLAVVHPRAVSLHRSQPAGSARNSWPGRIAAIEPVGDRLRVRVDATPPVVAEITTAAAAELALAEAVEVWIAVKATEVEVYPA